jgi:hypothetical protein
MAVTRCGQRSGAWLSLDRVFAPDGLAFGKSGKLNVALAGYSQISMPNANGAEVARYSGPAGTLPWANPANIAMDNGW